MIGFVIPTKGEARRLLELMGNPVESTHHGRRFFEGALHSKSCVAVISGCGKVLSAAGTQQLIDRYPDCSVLIHMGSAGALSRDLKVGDVVVGKELIGHDHYSHFGNLTEVPRATTDAGWVEDFVTFAADSKLRVVSGLILSGDEDIVTTQRRDELASKYGGSSVDWESFAFARVCNLCGIPCMVLRTVSDYAYEHTAAEFKMNYKKVSADLCQLVVDFLGRI